MFSVLWVTGSRQRMSPASNSTSSLLPSGVVIRSVPPVNTYTTKAGWECIASLSPGSLMYSRTRTWSFSSLILATFGVTAAASCGVVFIDVLLLFNGMDPRQPRVINAPAAAIICTASRRLSGDPAGRSHRGNLMVLLGTGNWELGTGNWELGTG